MTKELVGENEKGKIQGCLTRVLISVWTQSKDTTNRRPVQVLQYHWSSNHHAVLTLKSSFFLSSYHLFLFPAAQQMKARQRIVKGRRRSLVTAPCALITTWP